MSAQKYDNQAMNRKKAAMGAVTRLVKKGHRLNPKTASVHYLKAVRDNSGFRENRAADKELQRRSASGKY